MRPNEGMKATQLQWSSFLFVLGLCFAAFWLSFYSFRNMQIPSTRWTCILSSHRTNSPESNKMVQNCTEKLQKLLFSNATFSQFHVDKLDKEKFRLDSDLIVYRYDDQLIIWTYWDGPFLPPYIKLSMLTVQAHNSFAKILLLNDSSFKNSFVDFHSAFDFLQPQHKSDYVRCRFLERYRGIWIDADTCYKILTGVDKILKLARFLFSNQRMPTFSSK